MTRYLIGTGGWAYFQVPGEHPLKAYTRAFDFVEVNSTFYETPDLHMVGSWRRLAPPNFEFSVRCSKLLTHRYKFKAISEAYEVLKRMISICKILDAEILHMQTPPSFKPTKTNAKLMRNFFSTADLKSVRVSLEIRGARQTLTPDFIKMMRDLNMIHCVDFSKNEEPSFKSDIKYSRLFGKGRHNIYQPTDDELTKIDEKASKGEHRKVVISFHFTKMYKDAARFKIYKKTGKFPMVTKSTGLNSLMEVLQEDAKFPSSKGELIRHQGWKLIDFTEEKRVHASQILQNLPEKTYNSVKEVVETLESTKSQ